MTPDKKTQLYLTAAAMGGVASVMQLCAAVFAWRDFWQGVCVGVLLVSLLLLLVRSLRDEYIEGLWRAGTSAAFVALVVCFVSAPFVEGLYAGLSEAARQQHRPDGFVPMVAILCFFVAFHVKWLRGAR
jgi:glucan phosphoethanolaminetransferase (alkaline phosphatase superfamily)